MNAFLQRTAQERLGAFLEVSRVTRLDAISVEKDLWVCWTLRELFTLPGIGEHLTFKGGTSLSKAWKLIQRFSEDIDLIVDKEVLGLGGDVAPDKAPSNKQRRLRLEALMAASLEWVQGSLMPGLTERIKPLSATPVGRSRSIPTCPMVSACCFIIRRSSPPAVQVMCAPS